jgi:hypothetical protein
MNYETLSNNSVHKNKNAFDVSPSSDEHYLYTKTTQNYWATDRDAFNKQLSFHWKMRVVEVQLQFPVVFVYTRPKMENKFLSNCFIYTHKFSVLQIIPDYNKTVRL